MLKRGERQRNVSNVIKNIKACKGLKGYSEVEGQLMLIEGKILLLEDYYIFEKIIGTERSKGLTELNQIRYEAVKDINERKLCKEILILIEKLLSMKTNNDYYRSYVQASKRLVIELCDEKISI